MEIKQKEKKQKLREETQPRAQASTPELEIKPKDIAKFRCFCETLHLLSYPRLVDLAVRLLHIPKEEALKISKHDLCVRFALRSGVKDLKINDNIIKLLQAGHPEGIPDLMDIRQTKNVDKKCQGYFVPQPQERKQHYFDLTLLTDPMSWDVLTDFARILNTDQRLFNWDTLTQLHGNRHPYLNTPLPTGIQNKLKMDETTRERWRKELAHDWGFDYDPVAAPKPPPESFHLTSNVEFEPLAFALPQPPPMEGTPISLHQFLLRRRTREPTATEWENISQRPQPRRPAQISEQYLQRLRHYSNQP